MSVRDDLIRIYASSNVKDIHLNPEYQALLAAHRDDRVFEGERDIVEKAKYRVEKGVGEAEGGYAGQVKAAIWHLRRLRRDQHRDLHFRLIEAAYRCRPHAWSPEQQAHFDQAWALTQHEYDFFVSFSTRMPDETVGNNPVNDDYEFFIRRILSDDVYDKADKRIRNLLAETLHKILSEPPRKGFIFTHAQGNNKDVEKKLAAACASSAVFVQVVQNILFVSPGPRTNYCFWEYNKTLEAFGSADASTGRLLFVGAMNTRDQLVKLQDVPPDYDEWYAKASHKDVPYLERVHKFDADRVEALRQIVLTKVLPPVDSVFDRLLNNVPS